MHKRYFGWMIVLALAVPFARAADGDADKGETLYKNTCTVCHYADRTDKKLGPGLKGLFDRETLKNGKEVTDENVLEWINSGGNGMPAYKALLNDAQKQDLLAYLKTL